MPNVNASTPGRTWFHARHDAKAVCRALRINPDDDGAIYATTPFRIARVNDKVVVLAAHPAPRNFTPIDEDWLDIATVIAWTLVATVSARSPFTTLTITWSRA